MNTNSFFSRAYHSPILRIAAAMCGMLAWTNFAFCGEILVAAHVGDLAQVKAMLKEHPELVFDKGEVEGETVLHAAADGGNKEIAELLLANKADVNAKDRGGETPLHAAAHAGSKDVAEVLLANKADVNAKNDDGRTPLHAAAIDGRKDVAEVLLANKADVNSKDKQGETPLHEAAQEGRNDVAELLLANKADVNAKDNQRYSGISLSQQGRCQCQRQRWLDSVTRSII
jgi:ankyrin repeat protein